MLIASSHERIYGEVVSSNFIATNKHLKCTEQECKCDVISISRLDLAPTIEKPFVTANPFAAVPTRLH